jgi:hypothetical protein
MAKNTKISKIKETEETVGSSVDLTSEVTGVLPIANGGTNSNTASDARTALGVDAAGTDNSTNVTLTGTPDYITISGQEITRNQIDLANDVTGTLAAGNVATLNQNTTGQAGTVATIAGLAPNTATTAAAQPNITSLGTLTNLTVDDVTINGDTITTSADLNIVATGDDINVDTDNFTLESAGANKPNFTLKATSSGNKPATFNFVKDKGAAGADADSVGIIIWTGDDNAQTQTNFAIISGSVESATANNVEGKIEIGVAAIAGGSGSNGTNVITGKGNGDTTTDVTIGSGPTGVTAIAGTLTMGSTATLDNSGNLLTNAATATALTSGDKTIEGNLRIGGTGDTSNNFISIDAQNGDDSSGGGITFYETGTYSASAPQYGAKIVYNEDDDEFAIGTMHNNTFMRQIHMDRGSSTVNMQNIHLERDTGDGPFFLMTKTDTSIADGDSLCRIIARSADFSTSTNISQIQWFATEDHDSNSCGTKINFTVTPNGNSQSETTAMTIDQDSSVTINGDLTVTSGTSGDATLVISADTDNNDEGDNPRLWFKADGDIIEGAIQHKDNTFDIISNVSANGGIRFLTGTTNNTGTTDPETGATERMSIASNGTVTVAGALQPNTIELGHASDTTISRVAAGYAQVEGETIVTTITPAMSSAQVAQPIATLMARRTLTTAECNALHTTPIGIIPAPGANIVALPTGGMIRVDRASTNTNSGSVNFHYEGLEPGVFGTDSIVHIRRFHQNQTTDGSYNLITCMPSSTLFANSLTEDVNKAIEVSVDSAFTTDCFTSVDIYLTYQLIKIA